MSTVKNRTLSLGVYPLALTPGIAKFWARVHTDYRLARARPRVIPEVHACTCWCMMLCGFEFTRKAAAAALLKTEPRTLLLLLG